ncbi:hypothetical protein [Verrucosispora sp. WMMD1129]|uniref:DUF6907 domain-containing protein n=1 Tax=Verrucosispora sp. WMMD1129 TaxID=3016093 RepID=UPI00249AF513|nr:hypothetical protein [Verrucosispora sp. WMMD1129]WFE44993.1 hypothetical protein O7624_11920 [Verrucosispora sp. WMMD1129]
MSIIASVPTPPERRLIDAPTVDLARPIVRAESCPTCSETFYPTNYGTGEQCRRCVYDAERRAAQPRPADNRFPVLNSGAHRGDERTAQLAAAGSFDDGYAQGYADAVRHAVATFRARQDNPGRVAECPPWCSEDHRGVATEVDGFSVGLGHERMLVELTGQDPAYFDAAATASVYVESTSERGEVTTAPRVVVSVAEGAEGHYPGSEGVQGWTGTPAQARAFAAALLAGADVLDGGNR